MPFIAINGARLHYETWGTDQPGRPPLVLIHGSTVTGSEDWGGVAPLLAREYRVIVPDCRGHGQSSNPALSYSFREMAADTAALIGEMGYRRAHIIGHSNGGNVALVTLLEHPEVVQTCVLQAANAYVSPDLLVREPPLFDPDRVDREDPGWRQRLIALHGATLGPGYWRDLLRLTLRETISEPRYTSADLAAVGRAVLVIQGKDDPVNAPAGHAQFIAAGIPDAERWIPAGVRHNVHLAVPCAWLDRVLSFLHRRGDDANDALHRLGRRRFADSRRSIFQVRAEPASAPPQLALTGQVLTEEEHLAALAVMSSSAVEDRVRVLLPDSRWALVNWNVADVFREPRPLAERVTQALVGETVRVLEESENGWLHALLEGDGYLGWMRPGSLFPCSEASARSYLAAANALVATGLAPAYASKPSSVERARNPRPAGLLPLGVSLPSEDQSGSFTALRLPDGRRWWTASEGLLPLGSRPAPDAAGIRSALDLVRSLVGVPYLWGGRSPFGYDCSGLAQTLWGFLGVQIPRDADQQFCGLPPAPCSATAGSPVRCRPGDLLYFGEPDEESADPGSPRISHTAISLGGAGIIHANVAAGGISEDSLDPASPRYRPWLHQHLAGVRRPAGPTAAARSRQAGRTTPPGDSGDSEA